MKITMTRAETKTALAGFAKLGLTRSSLPILECIRMSAHEGEIVIQGTNLDEHVKFFAEGIAVDGQGAACIPLAQLTKLVSHGKPTDLVTFESEGKELRPKIKVTSRIGQNEMIKTIACYTLDEWPTESFSQPSEFKPAPLFLETYRRALPFTSKDLTRYVPMGVYLDRETGRMVGCDGRRLGMFDADLPIDKSITVPRSKFLEWNQLKDEASIAWNSTEEKLNVRTGPWLYQAKVACGTYPNYKQVIPTKSNEHAITFSSGDAELLAATLKDFPHASGTHVIAKLSCNGTVTVSSEYEGDKQSVTLKETTYKGKGLVTGVDGVYLAEALKTGMLTFRVEDDLSPLLSDIEGGTHVLMPIRVS